MYPVIRAKNRNRTMLQREKQLENQDVFEFLTFDQLSEIACIKHMFSTRFGGVSKGDCATLNFSFARGDDPQAVLENYARVAEVFGTDKDHFVTTDQTHTTNIRIVTKEDAGKGVTTARDYQDIDGLITDQKEIVLTCFFADCVPLYFVDPIKKVIGLAHSGWRGTVAGIGACMVKRMKEEFGCDPKDIKAAIGPSICQECYEISDEVAKQFKEDFWATQQVNFFCKETYEKGFYPHSELIKEGRGKGKYQLDLWLANMIVLRHAGICAENIEVTDICTCCNAPYLFSHRATNGKRGNLAAFLMLSE